MKEKDQSLAGTKRRIIAARREFTGVPVVEGSSEKMQVYCWKQPKQLETTPGNR